MGGLGLGSFGGLGFGSSMGRGIGGFGGYGDIGGPWGIGSRRGMYRSSLSDGFLYNTGLPGPSYMPLWWRRRLLHYDQDDEDYDGERDVRYSNRYNRREPDIHRTDDRWGGEYFRESRNSRNPRNSVDHGNRWENRQMPGQRGRNRRNIEEDEFDDDEDSRRRYPAQGNPTQSNRMKTRSRANSMNEQP